VLKFLENLPFYFDFVIEMWLAYLDNSFTLTAVEQKSSNVKGDIACKFRIITIQSCITIISVALNRSRRQEVPPVLW
jgi:hypothetical protein